MKTEDLIQKFTAMLEDARALLAADPFAQQAVLVTTVKGGQYHCLSRDIMSGDTTEEAALVQAMAENRDTRVQCLLCMWHSGCVDMPSKHLRDQLLHLDPGNIDAYILLNGGDKLHIRSLRDLIPH